MIKVLPATKAHMFAHQMYYYIATPEMRIPPSMIQATSREKYTTLPLKQI